MMIITIVRYAFCNAFHFLGDKDTRETKRERNNRFVEGPAESAYSRIAEIPAG